ncbi:MAG: Uma2 family endonuclease [Leptolyngbyaceae cyanobacterium RU_5_1]|nr:Uma2 family endonuclease [Leptolyngbyaceae cyanobacterium RU_5_1]
MVSIPNLNLATEPFSDEPELETSLHLAQIILLITCLEWWWQNRQDFFAAGNLSIYYQPIKLQSKKFRGPDFFVVLNTERRSRNSWVVANEGGKYPNLIVEILSPKTAKADRGVWNKSGNEQSRSGNEQSRLKRSPIKSNRKTSACVPTCALKELTQIRSDS